MHDRSHRPRSPRIRARAILPAFAAAAALLAPAAAHASPPGANGPIFGQIGESFDYRMLDATKGIDDNIDTPTWAGGGMLGALRSSPDGMHVAYVSTTDNRIAVADVADGGNERLIGGTGGAHDLAYSPDGKTIIFTVNNKIMTVPADGSEAPKQLGSNLQGAWAIDWGSNDGGIVVQADGAGFQNDLYRMDATTGAVTPLTATADVSEDEVSFSPDGERLVVGVDGSSAPGDERLDVMDVTGANRHTLLTEQGIQQAQWAPDGTRIAFVTEAGPDGEDVGTIAPEGSGRKAVANVSAIGLSWPIKPGTGNKPPTADFTFTPAQPYTTGDTTFTSTASDPDGTIAEQLWDLDGDGEYDDASGPTAHVTFATAGAHTVGLRVRDQHRATAKATKSITVLVGGKPGGKFTVDPASPAIGEPATFTAAANADPHAQVQHHEWDFDGDGTYDYDSGTALTAQHTYPATGPVTAKLKVTDAEGDTDVTSVSFEVKDVQRCGTERVGRLVLEGCLVVKGNRRIAPDGITVNGFRIGATDAAVPAFDVAQYRAATIPKADVQRTLDGAIGLPDAGLSVPVGSACGEQLGTSRFALNGFAKDDAKAPLTIGDATTFAGLRARDAGDLSFGDGVAQFEFHGLFPKLLLNWTLEGRGTYAVAPGADCKDNHLTVRLGSFLSRFMQFAEVRLERSGTNRWDGSNDMSIKGFPTAVKTTVTAIDGKVRALSFELGEMPIMPGSSLRGGKLTMRLDRGAEELSGRGSFVTAPRLFGKDFFAVEGSVTLGRNGFKIAGVSKVAGMEIGWGSLELDADTKSLAAEADVEVDLGPANAKASVSGYVEPLRLIAEIEGHGSAGVDGIGKIGADLFLSTRGIAACGHVSLSPFGSADPGFSYRWGDTWPKVFLDSCDFGDLRVVRATRASAAAAGSGPTTRTVQVSGGQRGVVLVAKGRPGRAPYVAVTGPHGQKITSKKNGKGTKKGRFMVVPNKQDGTTNVLVMKPAAGTWKIRSLDGRALRSVGSANALPKPSIAVTRKGKALRWKLRRIAGQSVALVEIGANGTRRVLVKGTNKPAGSVTYKPAAGATQVVAEVTQNGLRRATKKVVDLKKKATTKKKATKKKK